MCFYLLLAPRFMTSPKSFPMYQRKIDSLSLSGRISPFKQTRKIEEQRKINQMSLYSSTAGIKKPVSTTSKRHALLTSRNPHPYQPSQKQTLCISLHSSSKLKQSLFDYIQFINSVVPTFSSDNCRLCLFKCNRKDKYQRLESNLGMKFLPHSPIHHSAYCLF